MSDAGMTEAERQEALRREIEETRQELGETVEALSRKADVKAQVQEKRDQVKQQVLERTELVQQRARAKRTPIAAIGGGVAAGVLALWLIRRR